MKKASIVRHILFSILCLGLLTDLPGQWRNLNIDLDPDNKEEIQEFWDRYLPNSVGYEFKESHRSQSPVGIHLTFQRLYQGIPIHGKNLRLHITEEGKVFGMSASPAPTLPQTRLAVQPFISVQTKAELFAQNYQAHQWEGEYCWWTREDEWKLAYRMKILSTQAESLCMVLIFDCEEGNILKNEDIASYYNHSNPHVHRKDTSGWGRVFLPDPCTRSQTTYGTSFVDNEDAHLPVFEPLMDTVELQDITYDQDRGLFLLQGPFVKVVDRAAYFDSIAVSATGDFFFTRDQSQFEDVMAYYHIDRFRRYVGELGFTDLYDRPIEIDPHGLGNNDLSVFVPNGSNSYILMGDGGVDDGEDADVIVHEYIHALSHDAAPETNQGFERQGVDEGYADYFAAVYSYQLSLWNWFELFNWDGQNEFWSGRDVLSIDPYPVGKGFASIYEVGSLWASILVSIRTELGGEITDRLVLQTMYLSYPEMGLRNAGDLLLQADSLLYDGVHTGAIRDELCQRNFFSSSTCIAVANEREHHPTLLFDAEISIYPNPVRGKLNLDWKGMKEVGLQLYDLQGREILKRELQSLGGSQIELPKNLVPGTYLLKVEVKDEQPLFRKINIIQN